MIGAGPADRGLVDTRDMVVVHTALLREFRLAPGLVRRTHDGARARARAVGAHLSLLVGLLEHHHNGEDRLLWPILRQRLPTSLSAPLAVAVAQHEAIHTATDTVRHGIGAWTDEPSMPHRDGLATSLEGLRVLLVEHLDHEEKQLLPLAAAYLTGTEWDAIGEAGVAAIPKHKLAMVFGMFMYEADPDVVKTMLAAAPALPRALLPLLAPHSYARYALRIHHTPTP